QQRAQWWWFSFPQELRLGAAAAAEQLVEAGPRTHDGGQVAAEAPASRDPQPRPERDVVIVDGHGRDQTRAAQGSRDLAGGDEQLPSTGRGRAGALEGATVRAVHQREVDEHAALANATIQ